MPAAQGLRLTNCPSWNARIELSTAVFLELHKMPNLRSVHIRLQAGQSLHSIPKLMPGLNQSSTSLNASPISPGPPPPPGPHSPGGYGYGQPTPPSNTFRMVPKIPVTKPANQPHSFSGFKTLKSLCALDMDTLEYIPEIAECVRNSLETLKQLELSLSDTLGRRAREKPRVDGSDGATSDDASSVASIPVNNVDDGAPLGGTPEQMRQWHKARQEAILGKIFEPKTQKPNVKELESAANEIVRRVDRDARKASDGDNSDGPKDDEDKEFVKMMRGIFRDARMKQEPSSKGSKALEKIEKAASKYLESRPKTIIIDYTKPKPKSKPQVIKVHPPKPPPPVNSWQPPPVTIHKNYSVSEEVLLSYFGFSKTTWDQMGTMTKNQYVQDYFKETAAVPYQPYPMPPPAPGKPYGKIYYAAPNTVPSYPQPSKWNVIPKKKIKKPPPPKPKYLSDSDDAIKSPKNGKLTIVDIGAPNGVTSPAKKGYKTDDALSDDSDMLYPSVDEDEGPDQEFDSGDELNRRAESPVNTELEDLKEGINGVLKESGFFEESNEVQPPDSPILVGKGKEAVRDPPNGHLTSPKPDSHKVEIISKPATKPEEEEKENEGDPVSKYLRLSHGLPIERLAIYLIPVKPATFLQHFDPYSLKNLTLLNVGSQRRLWATLTKLQRQSPLPLTSIYTDNVTPALLTFVDSLEAGQLDDLFLLERYLRKKGRVPQLQDCDQTGIEKIDAIRKQILKKHMKGFKRLMIRNDDADTWAVNNSTVKLIAREGVKLRELAVMCDTVTFVSPAPFHLPSFLPWPFR
jgi:hypothetical protein